MFYITDDQMRIRFMTMCTEKQFRDFSCDGYAVCSEENGALKISETARWLLEREIPFIADIRMTLSDDDVTPFVIFCADPEYEILWQDYTAPFDQGRTDVIVVPDAAEEASRMFLPKEGVKILAEVMAANEAARKKGLLISPEERADEMEKKKARASRQRTVLPFPLFH